MKRLLIALAFVIALSPAVRAADRICTPSNFMSNFNAAAPGDRLILRSDAGTYGNYWLPNKHGNASNLIQIIAQDPMNPPVFQTSAQEGLQIASCSYMLWDGIEVRGPLVEGIHLQDAGSGPSHHIIMRNVKVTMGSAAGNIDNWKCDYTSDVLFYNCTGLVNGDVAFDMMGCVGQLIMRSYSTGNTFAHAKNGSHNIGYYKNVITNTGERNFQFGGNGLYCYDQIAMGNVLYGTSPQSVVYTTARNVEFRYNTVQNLTGGAIMRVLNEGSATPPTGNNTFSNNLIHYNGSALTWPGSNTDPASFTVANNFWSQTPNFMGYMTETGGVVGNPQLNSEFLPQNPAARHYGAYARQMETEWAAYTNRFAWAWSIAQQYEPRAEPGSYQVALGNGVTLSGAASYAGTSPYGPYSINNYEWDLDDDGLFDDAVGVSVNLSASQLAALGLGQGVHYIGLRVRITNEQGQYMYDEGWGTLTVVANNPPTVDAGADVAYVYEGRPVSLHAAAADPDGNPLTYAWTQTAGKTVSLTGAATADVSFTAPVVASQAEASLTLQVEVSDGQGGTSSDSVNVRVRLRGDVTCDDKVNVFDLQRLAASWNKSQGETGYDAACDFTGDNKINVFDLQAMAGNWNKTLPQ